MEAVSVFSIICFLIVIFLLLVVLLGGAVYVIRFVRVLHLFTINVFGEIVTLIYLLVTIQKKKFQKTQNMPTILSCATQ